MRLVPPCLTSGPRASRGATRSRSKLHQTSKPNAKRKQATSKSKPQANQTPNTAHNTQTTAHRAPCTAHRATRRERFAMGFVMEPTSASKQDYKLCRTTATAATATTTAASTGTATATAKHYSTVARADALATYMDESTTTSSNRWLLDIVSMFLCTHVSTYYHWYFDGP